MSGPLLTIRNLQVSFGAGPVLEPLNLEIRRGELLALVGESGSGKSVTALSILRLLPGGTEISGEILFGEGDGGIDLLRLGERPLQALRGNRIAMIFQEPMTALNPVIRCGPQVAEVLRQHHGLGCAAAKQETVEWLRRVRLPHPETIYGRFPHELSGGQKQRVMIALALCCRPALLICDEPTTALDVTVQRAVLDLIRELQQELGTSVLFITHDLGVVADIADRVAVLYRGRLVETGDAASVLRHPKESYTKALLACRPALHTRGQRLPVVADILEGRDGPEELSPPPVPKENIAVEIRGLVVRYSARKKLWSRSPTSTTAVDGVSLEIREGETLGLVGESGCGKTTLGRALLGLVAPSEGSIRVGGYHVTGGTGKLPVSYRRAVQLVFQDPYSALNPRMRIGAALEEPLKVHAKLSAGERRLRAEQLLDQVGLPASAADRYPDAFSGGQRQRLVIARALALQPAILVCDESVSALDVSVQAQVLNLLNDLRRDLGLTMLFISHDLSVVRYISDRIAVMQAGRIVETGPSEYLYNNPQEPYTKMLLEAVPGRSLLSVG